MNRSKKSSIIHYKITTVTIPVVRYVLESLLERRCEQVRQKIRNLEEQKENQIRELLQVYNGIDITKGRPKLIINLIMGAVENWEKSQRYIDKRMVN
jgi:hypothetical protein